MKIRSSVIVYSVSGLAAMIALAGCHPEPKEVLGNRDYIPAPKTDVSVPEQTPTMVMPPSDAAAAMNPAEVPAEASPAVDVPAETPAKPVTKPATKPAGKSYPKFVGNTSKPVVKPGSGSSSVPRSSAKAGDGSYTVRGGDTLSGIAHKNGVKTADLAAVNGLALDSTLRVGQKLKLPAGAKAAAASSGKSSGGSTVAKAPAKASSSAKSAERPADGVYVVQKNDSLWTIARKFDTRVATLCELNGIPADKSLKLGQKIKLPGASASAAADASTSAAPTAAATSASTSYGTDSSYGSASTGTAATGVDTTGTAATGAYAVPGDATGAATVQPGAADAANAATGAAVSAEPATRTQEVQRDVEIGDLCKLFNWNVEEIKRLNPNLPADGILRRGQIIVVPVKK